MPASRVAAHEGGGSDITPPTVALRSLTAKPPSHSDCTVCALDLSMAKPGVCAMNLASSSDGDDFEQCWSLVLTPTSAGNFQAESDLAVKVCGY